MVRIANRLAKVREHSRKGKENAPTQNVLRRKSLITRSSARKRANFAELKFGKEPKKDEQESFDFDVSDNSQTSKPLSGLSIAVSVYSERISPTRTSSRRRAKPDKVILDDTSKSYKNMIESLGGTFQTAISRSTTHLLFLKGTSNKAKKARERGIKIVSCKWIKACFDSKSYVGEQDYIVDVTEVVRDVSSTRRHSSSFSNIHDDDIECSADVPKHVKRSRKSEDCLRIDTLPNPSERRFSSSQILNGDESSDDQESLFGHNEGQLNFGEQSSNNGSEDSSKNVTPIQRRREHKMPTTPKSPPPPPTENGTRQSSSGKRSNKFNVSGKGLNASALRRDRTTIFDLERIARSSKEAAGMVGTCNIDNPLRDIIATQIQSRMGEGQTHLIFQQNPKGNDIDSITHVIVGSHLSHDEVRKSMGDVLPLYVCANGGHIVSVSWMIDNENSSIVGSEDKFSISSSSEWLRGVEICSMFNSILKLPKRRQIEWESVLNYIKETLNPRKDYTSVIETKSLLRAKRFSVHRNLQEHREVLSKLIVLLGGVFCDDMKDEVDFVVVKDAVKPKDIANSRNKFELVTVDTFLDVARYGFPLGFNEKLSSTRKTRNRYAQAVSLDPDDEKFLNALRTLAHLKKQGVDPCDARNTLFKPSEMGSGSHQPEDCPSNSIRRKLDVEFSTSRPNRTVKNSSSISDSADQNSKEKSAETMHCSSDKTWEVMKPKRNTRNFSSKAAIGNEAATKSRRQTRSCNAAKQTASESPKSTPLRENSGRSRRACLPRAAAASKTNLANAEGSFENDLRRAIEESLKENSPRTQEKSKKGSKSKNATVEEGAMNQPREVSTTLTKKRSSKKGCVHKTTSQKSVPTSISRTKHRRSLSNKTTIAPKISPATSRKRARKELGMVIAYSKCDQLVVDMLSTICNVASMPKANIVHGTLEDGDIIHRNITHVVVGDESKRTAKVLLGLASGAWVLKPSWVFESLENQKWVDEQNHQVDASIFPAVKHRRTMSNLFKDEVVCVRGSTMPPRSFMASLFSAAGAKICQRAAGATLVIDPEDVVSRNGEPAECSRSDRWAVVAFTNGRKDLPDPVVST